MMLQQKLKLLLDENGRSAMRRAGRFNAELMDIIRPHVQAGVSTNHLDKLAHEYTSDHGHIPAPLNYQGFPKSCCTSVNEVICHGIPGEYVLQEGDIVNLDLTTIVDGWHGDSSETFLIGEVSEEAKTLIQCSFDSLNAAIQILKPDCPVSHIGEAITSRARDAGFSVVREYVGHGLGREFHQEPSVPHFPNRESQRTLLPPGICFTIEPMINAGKRLTQLDPTDGWTVRTKDLKLSAQFEHSVLMTETGPEILTKTQNGPQPGHVF